MAEVFPAPLFQELLSLMKATHAISPSVPELFKLRHRTWSMVQLCKMDSASCRKAKDSEISGSAITTVQVQLDRWT